MIPPGCVSRPTRRVSTVRCPKARCLRMKPGRRIVFHFSRSGWTRVALPKQVVKLGGCVEKYRVPTRELLVGDHFAEIGDVLPDSGDLFWPGIRALIWNSGSIFSFGFGKRVG